MRPCIENRTRLGSELKDKLWDIFEDNGVMRAYIFNYNNKTNLIIGFNYGGVGPIKEIEGKVEERLGYNMKVYSMTLFDIGEMNWQEPGISKEIKERIEFLYEISCSMELLYDTALKKLLLEEDKLYW